MNKKIGTLIYTPHFKEFVEGSIYKREEDGSLLIANVTPAACISQEQHNQNMEMIVAALNDLEIGKLLGS